MIRWDWVVWLSIESLFVGYLIFLVWRDLRDWWMYADYER